MKGLLLITLVALTTTCSTAVPTCAPGEDGTLLGNPADCHSYYECVNGTPVLMQCPPGLEWAEHSKRCDFPNEAKCTETETEVPTTQVPTTEGGTPTPSTPRPTECPAEDDPNHDVLLPNPDDCGSFFKCLGGEPHLIQCPPGQEWSIELNRCDYPEIAHCEKSFSKKIALLLNLRKDDRCPDEDGEEDVLLPNPEDCATFYKCNNGELIIQECPAGLHWNNEAKLCDYPESAGCQNSKIKVFLPFQIKKDDRCPDEDGDEDVLLPNPEDCTTFYKCNNGELVIQDCPAGLHWNDQGKYCDYPSIAGCQKALVFAQNEWPTECPAENGMYDFFLPNLDDCTTYFKCDNGRKILMDCPVGTLWDAPMQRCDHAVNARCA